MAHFAEIDKDNVVIRVLVVDDIYEKNGQDYLANECGLGGTWIQTSYNTVGGQHQKDGIPFRKNFAGIGYTYDKEKDAFIPPKVFDSHVLNNETCLWEPPVPMPTDGKLYDWNENELKWVEIPVSE